MSMYDCEKCGGAIGMFCYCTPTKTTPSSNLDIAHECGGIWRAGDDEPSLMCFTLFKLDAFADRIRAEATVAANDRRVASQDGGRLE